MSDFNYNKMNVTLKFKKTLGMETISGNANFENWIGNAPNLVSIGGSYYFNGWKGSAPKLRKINKRKFEWKSKL